MLICRPLQNVIFEYEGIQLAPFGTFPNIEQNVLSNKIQAIVAYMMSLKFEKIEQYIKTINYLDYCLGSYNGDLNIPFALHLLTG